MHRLRNRFLHVAVLALAVVGALIVGALRPTQSSAQSGIVIPAANQVSVFCIQDDRYPHNFLQFVAISTNPPATGIVGQWSYTQCAGSGGALAATTNNPKLGQSKINKRAAATDFDPAFFFNPYDVVLADNYLLFGSSSAFSLFRFGIGTLPFNLPNYPGLYGKLGWPNVLVVAGVTERVPASPGGEGRQGEAFIRTFAGGPVYHIFDSNIDDGASAKPSPDSGHAWPTTCTCP